MRKAGLCDLERAVFVTYGVPHTIARRRLHLPVIRLDEACAAKTWPTVPPLKTEVLIGSIVSGARKIRTVTD